MVTFHSVVPSVSFSKSVASVHTKLFTVAPPLPDSSVPAVHIVPFHFSTCPLPEGCASTLLRSLRLLSVRLSASLSMVTVQSVVPSVSLRLLVASVHTKSVTVSPPPAPNSSVPAVHFVPSHFNTCPLAVGCASTLFRSFIALLVRSSASLSMLVVHTTLPSVIESSSVVSVQFKSVILAPPELPSAIILVQIVPLKYQKLLLSES